MESGSLIKPPECPPPRAAKSGDIALGDKVALLDGERALDGGEIVCLSDMGVVHLSRVPAWLLLSSSSSTSTDQSDTPETSLLWTESLLSILLLSTCPPQLLDIGTSRMSFGGGNVSLSSPNMSRPMESLSPLISSLSLFLWNLGGRLDLTAADLGLPDGGFPLGSHKSSLLGLDLSKLSCLDQPSRSLESLLFCPCLPNVWLLPLPPPLPNPSLRLCGGEGVLLMVLLLPLGGEVFLLNTLVCRTGELVLLWSKLVGELRLEFPLLL